MSLADSTITFSEVLGSTSLTIDVFVMPVQHLDMIGRDMNGLTYVRDVATAAYIQEVSIVVHRMSLTRPEFDQLWLWMTAGTSLLLDDHAHNVPIDQYVGKIARLQPDMFHDAKQGDGPYEIVFKPDSAARPSTAP